MLLLPLDFHYRMLNTVTPLPRGGGARTRSGLSCQLPHAFIPNTHMHACLLVTWLVTSVSMPIYLAQSLCEHTCHTLPLSPSPALMQFVAPHPPSRRCLRVLFCFQMPDWRASRWWCWWWCCNPLFHSPHPRSIVDLLLYMHNPSR